LLFEDKDLSAFISMFQIGEASDRMITIWEGPSGCYSIVIFRFEKKKIKAVLTESSKRYPEVILDQSSSGGEFVLMTTTDELPVTTIYRWVKGEYKVFKKVPFSERFKALTEADK